MQILGHTLKMNPMRQGSFVLISSYRKHISTRTLNFPSKASNTWERGAKLVKNTDVTNQYLEHIRDVHDPSLHLKTIEDELKGTIGKALGRQGQKILDALKSMQKEGDSYHNILRQTDSDIPCNDAVNAKLNYHANKYNDFRSQALKARWELLVHRQAVGFVVNNHKFVHEKFPIPEAIRTSFHDESDHKSSSNLKSSTIQTLEPVKRNFGNQLHW
eukprot:CAMPEP_0184869470 /NCGR_PEP_ID=MMETSP0580-20130426/34184_1 /TAXON_ID=1118495 /ORGANISM="Dactyliosolen fragilissimus" /LENGTH=215 /DNA_ID=CAMNT_0027370973 /DNA_START=45 /DNA_END=689 /DNA_ORIENTATION=+